MSNLSLHAVHRGHRLRSPPAKQKSNATCADIKSALVVQLVQHGWWWIAGGLWYHGGALCPSMRHMRKPCRRPCCMLEVSVVVVIGGCGCVVVVQRFRLRIQLALHVASYLAYIRSRATCGESCLALHCASLRM